MGHGLSWARLWATKAWGHGSACINNQIFRFHPSSSLFVAILRWGELCRSLLRQIGLKHSRREGEQLWQSSWQVSNLRNIGPPLLARQRWTVFQHRWFRDRIPITSHWPIILLIILVLIHNPFFDCFMHVYFLVVKRCELQYKFKDLGIMYSSLSYNIFADQCGIHERDREWENICYKPGLRSNSTREVMRERRRTTAVRYRTYIRWVSIAGGTKKRIMKRTPACQASLRPYPNYELLAYNSSPDCQSVLWPFYAHILCCCRTEYTCHDRDCACGTHCQLSRFKCTYNLKISYILRRIQSPSRSW